MRPRHRNLSRLLRQAAALSRPLKCCRYLQRSECQMQRHLNEARAPDRVLDKPKITLWRTGKSTGARAQRGCQEAERELLCRALPIGPVNRRILGVRREAYVVVWDVEAGVVKKVENLSVVPEREPLGDPELLKDTEVEAVLKRATKDVSLIYRRESSFKKVTRPGTGVTRRNAIRSWRKRRGRTKGERVQNRVVGIYSRCALKDRFCR